MTRNHLNESFLASYCWIWLALHSCLLSHQKILKKPQKNIAPESSTYYFYLPLSQTPIICNSKTMKFSVSGPMKHEREHRNGFKYVFRASHEFFYGAFLFGRSSVLKGVRMNRINSCDDWEMKIFKAVERYLIMGKKLKSLLVAIFIRQQYFILKFLIFLYK